MKLLLFLLHDEEFVVAVGIMVQDDEAVDDFDLCGWDNVEVVVG